MLCATKGWTGQFGEGRGPQVAGGRQGYYISIMKPT
jgi:hypothetical protein